MNQLPLPAIYNYFSTEKERTAFFLLQVLFLILVGYDNHWDCLIKKALCCSKACLKEEEEEEPEEVLVLKKHLAEKRDAFVQYCNTAPGGMEEHPFLGVLLKIIEDSEKEVLAQVKASGPNFVTTTTTTTTTAATTASKNNNNNKKT